ncbi:DUF6789 family protein [Desulfosporosinus sp. SB140]|uniref:DUF6789 family protein n=1 Tax=Desulfosporosinus paludis TaxID=3115649 RepID=UPI00388EA74E
MNISRILSVFKSVHKIKDSIVLGLIGGLAGTIVMDLSNFFLWRTNKTEGLYGHLAGSMIMRSFRTNQTKNFLLGQILHTFTGATLGIPFVYLLKKTGKDHHLIKGMIFGGLSWGILYDFGQKIGFFYGKAHLTKSHYSSLFNNFLFGITTAHTVYSLADSSVFPQAERHIAVQHEKPKSTTSYSPPEIVDNMAHEQIFYH